MLTAELGEGAMFHLCHAWECAMCAILTRLEESEITTNHAENVSAGMHLIEKRAPELFLSAITLWPQVNFRNVTLYVPHTAKRPQDHGDFETQAVQPVLADIVPILDALRTRFEGIPIQD
ncbi:MAG TPA: hypothetical protein VGO93_05680 [Candidatus Xenobia bacterium]